MHASAAAVLHRRLTQKNKTYTKYTGEQTAYGRTLMRCCCATTHRPALKSTMTMSKSLHHIDHGVARDTALRRRRQRQTTKAISARCALPGSEMQSRWFLADMLVSAPLASTEYRSCYGLRLPDLSC